MSLRNEQNCLRLILFPLWNFAAQSDDQMPASKPPVQRKTKEAVPKKAATSKKPAAPKKKAAGIYPKGQLSLPYIVKSRCMLRRVTQ